MNSLARRPKQHKPGNTRAAPLVDVCLQRWKVDLPTATKRRRCRQEQSPQIFRNFHLLCSSLCSLCTQLSSDWLCITFLQLTVDPGHSHLELEIDVHTVFVDIEHDRYRLDQVYRIRLERELK